MPYKTYLATKNYTVDLEYTLFRLEKGKTYVDDETTMLWVYLPSALKSGRLEEVPACLGSAVVSHPTTRSVVH